MADPTPASASWMGPPAHGPLRERYSYSQGAFWYSTLVLGAIQYADASGSLGAMLRSATVEAWAKAMSMLFRGQRNGRGHRGREI